MIDRKYLSEFKKSSVYAIIKNGIEENDIINIILLNTPYRNPFDYDKVNINPSQVLWSLYLLLGEEIITIEEINKAFTNINISDDNASLLLYYILLSKGLKNDTDIEIFDYNTLFSRINEMKGDLDNNIQFRNIYNMIVDA